MPLLLSYTSTHRLELTHTQTLNPNGLSPEPILRHVQRHRSNPMANLPAGSVACPHVTLRDHLARVLNKLFASTVASAAFLPELGYSLASSPPRIDDASF